jgi:hypothetical protein
LVEQLAFAGQGMFIDLDVSCKVVEHSRRRLSASLGVVGFADIPTPYSDRGAKTGHAGAKIPPPRPAGKLLQALNAQAMGYHRQGFDA